MQSGGPQLSQASEFTAKMNVPIFHQEAVTTVDAHLAYTAFLYSLCVMN